MAFSFSIRLPRPQGFLFLLSLSTANTLLLYLFILNKASAFYGLLSQLTGAPMSVLQASMYVYSFTLLGFVLFYLAPRIRFSGSSPLAPDPFRTLLWGYIYAIDSVINAMYTASFAFLWFVHVAREEASKEAASGGAPSPGAELPLDMGKALFQNGSIVSLVLIILFWSIRFYSVFVVLSYTRLVIRHHIAVTSTLTANGIVDYSSSGTSDMAEDPFRIGTDAGDGWKGQLGRILINFGRSYWLGPDGSVPTPDLESGMASAWLNGFSRKFVSKSSGSSASSLSALEERERRRRSGTGPPAPSGLSHISIDSHTHSRMSSIEMT